VRDLFFPTANSSQQAAGLQDHVTMREFRTHAQVIFSKRKGRSGKDHGASGHQLSNASGLGSRIDVDPEGRRSRSRGEHNHPCHGISSATKSFGKLRMRDAANFVWLASSVFVCLSFGASLEQGGAFGFQHGVAGAFAHAAL
jgi:hypothetical protein